LLWNVHDLGRPVFSAGCGLPRTKAILQAKVQRFGMHNTSTIPRKSPLSLSRASPACASLIHSPGTGIWIFKLGCLIEDYFWPATTEKVLRRRSDVLCEHPTSPRVAKSTVASCRAGDSPAGKSSGERLGA